jgi:hypothetical protein
MKNSYLSHVDETLCETYYKESVLLSVVVASEHAEVAGKTGVVRSGADEAESEDGVLRNLFV